MQVEKHRRYQKELLKIVKSSKISERDIDYLMDLFISNKDHPSLDFKVITGCKRIQNCHQLRVSKDYRVLFSLFEEEKLITLMHIGSHNYIERKIKNC